MIQTKKYSYLDLEKIPEDGLRREIHHGELIILPSPSKEHQDILGNLNDLVRPYVRLHRLGYTSFAPFDVILEFDETAIPDYLFVRAERLEMVTNRAILGAPDWMVEILSPTSGKRDLESKKQLYQDHGVELYWVIDPVRQEVLVWQDDWAKPRVYTILENIEVSCIQGLSFAVADLFAAF